MKAKRNSGPVHFFASSFLNWNTSDDLAKLIRRQKKYDQDGSIKPKGFNLWMVPGADADTKYRIDDYSPSVEGAEFIAFIVYQE